MGSYCRSIGRAITLNRFSSELIRFSGLTFLREVDHAQAHDGVKRTVIPRANTSQPAEQPSSSSTTREGNFPEHSPEPEYRNLRSSSSPFSLQVSGSLLGERERLCNASSSLLLDIAIPRHHLRRSFSASPVSSPLLPSLAKELKKGGATGSEIDEQRRVRAKLAGIKQGVLKVNLVATLVRGMTVHDALTQLAVTPKRAAKTVSKVIHAAKSNAVTNHGLDESKLVVDEAFVGKGLFLKRVNPHGKGRSGVKVRQRCQLTVWVREMTTNEMLKRDEARSRQSTWRKQLRRLVAQKMMPHQLIQTGNAPKVPQVDAGSGVA